MRAGQSNLLFSLGLFAVCAVSADVQGATTRPSTQPTTLPAVVLPPPRTSPESSSRKVSAASSLTDLSLEQLMQVEVTTNTLTVTQRQLVPAAVTTIDSDEISQQNPRTLNDLLTIYVPNLETSHHPFELPSVGIRGIISDNNTKYLLLVNGREMNERTHFGALTEQDLYLLGDLQQVDVIRGPGSATYGPGAVEGIISMTTFNGLNYQGTDATIRGGVLDDFVSAEFKHGEKLSADSGWFIYGGAAQVTGANSSNAPIVEGQNFTAPGGEHVEAGKPAVLSIQRQGAEFGSEPQIKAHAEYDNGGFSLWARYTRGGEVLDATDRTFAPFPTGFGAKLPPAVQGVGYQQLTGFVGDKIGLTDKLELDLSTSIDATDYERIVTGNTQDSFQEDKVISKAILNWQMFASNQLAVGTEYGFYWLGRPTWMDPTLDGIDSAIGKPVQWTSNMLSIFFEDQWHLNSQFTLFVSARGDKDRFTNWLYSPRAALAYAPDDKDTVKFIASQSLRTNTEEFMYLNAVQSDSKSAPEAQNSLELRYERQQTDNLLFASSIFYNRLAAVNYSSASHGQVLLGSYKTAGVEVEASYHTQNDTVTLSHAYTKLVGQSFATNTGEFITAAPYGFGYDLNNWSNNDTKLSVHHQFSNHFSQFSVDGNIQVMWGYQGSQDYLNYKNTIPFFPAANPVVTDSVPGYTQPYGVTAYLNLGAEYKIDDHQSVRIDAYNVLGWFDQTLNKDDVIGSVWAGSYRVQSPAVALTYRLAL